MLTVKIIENNIMYSVQERHLPTLSFSAEVTLVSFISSTVSVYSSTNLSTIFSLHLQFSQSKYSPTSHDLSHSYSQLLRFQINPLSHIPLTINSLHSHLYLSLFQRCLLLQMLASTLHLHLHISCHYTLHTLTSKLFILSGVHIFAC